MLCTSWSTKHNYAYACVRIHKVAHGLIRAIVGYKKQRFQRGQEQKNTQTNAGTNSHKTHVHTSTCKTIRAHASTSKHKYLVLCYRKFRDENKAHIHDPDGICFEAFTSPWNDSQRYCMSQLRADRRQTNCCPH